MALVACGKTSMALGKAIPDQRLLCFGLQLEMLSHVRVVQTVEICLSNVRSSNNTRLYSVAARILNTTWLSRAFQSFTAASLLTRLFRIVALLREFWLSMCFKESLVHDFNVLPRASQKHEIAQPLA